MSGFRIACQTITWGPSQGQRLPEVLSEVAAAGYDGVEVGLRHLLQVPAKDFRMMLADTGLVLAASHVGGNLEDRSQAAGERTMLQQALDYLETVGAGLLMYSGLSFRHPEQLASDLEVLNHAARTCREAGVRLLYHNHDWEFAHEGAVVRALLERGDEALGFCPDVGWVAKAGQEVVPFLGRLGGRLGAVHMKDFATTTPGAVDTCLLGKGILPLAETAAWLLAAAPRVWVIAEQDQADVPALQAATHNARVLREHLGAGR